MFSAALKLKSGLQIRTGTGALNSKLSDPGLFSKGRCLLLPLLIGILGTACNSASLHDLVVCGAQERAEALLARRPEAVRDKNELGKTPLHYATHAGQVDMMALLLAHDADLQAQDQTGMSALHVAAMAGQQEAAQWLLTHGALLEAKDHFGDTPLHTAAAFGEGGLVRFFASQGANIQGVNKAGLTPMALAQKYHRDQVVKVIQRLLVQQEKG